MSTFAKTDEAVAKILEKVTALTETHGSQAWETAVRVQQYDAIGNIGMGILSALAMAGLIVLCFWCIHKREDTYHPGFGLGAVGSGMVSFILMIPTCVLLLDPWSWIGMFNPELALIHTLMQSVAK